MSTIQELETRICQLESLLGLGSEFDEDDDRFVLERRFGLTRTESRVLSILMKRDIARTTTIETSLYGGRAEGDQPDTNVITVFISKIRRKVSPLGIVIKTRSGVGWYLEPDAKTKLKGLCAA